MNSSRESSKAPLFDAFAGSYDDALSAGLSISGESKDYFAAARVAWLGNCLRRQRMVPRQILDYGCGTGSTIPFLLKLVPDGSVTGVDVSASSLDVARHNHTSSRVTLIEPAKLPTRDFFDLAYCNGVFHHVAVDERAEAAALIFKTLEPGGYFSFWENNPWNPGTRIVMSRIPFDRDARTLTHREAARLLRGVGFQIVSIDFLFYFPRCLRWLRFLEPALVRVPLGAQYQILCRRPSS